MLKIVYTPNLGVTIDEVALNWGAKRHDVRKLLNNCHQTQRPEHVLITRDIYQDYRSVGSFFFLNYNESNYLTEVEVHEGVDIVIYGIFLTFERQLSAILTDLQGFSEFIEIGYHNYLLIDLKLAVIDSEGMGGEGATLAYFYCAENIDHLIDHIT